MRASLDNYDILYPKRDGSYRIIKAGSWFIFRGTPCGEDAELYEIKPYGGKKLLDIYKVKRP